MTGFSEIPFSLALDRTASSVRPSFNPTTLVGVFCRCISRICATSDDVHGLPEFRLYLAIVVFLSVYVSLGGVLPAEGCDQDHLPCLSNSLQWEQSGFPPVPCRKFSFSMLLPSVQLVLSWWTGCFTECQGDVFITSSFRFVSTELP